MYRDERYRLFLKDDKKAFAFRKREEVMWRPMRRKRRRDRKREEVM